jgi:hypothetical protein
MAIRQIGGQPVYVVEVDVPKVTDARGRSYGTLVSDLRWKLWEEVQNSQLQQMNFEKLSKQAQLDVLEQKQRDISRAIRDANELKSQIKADVVKGTAPARGYVEKTRKPALSPYTGKPTGEIIETTRTRTPIGDIGGTGATVESAADVQARRDELDKYIKGLETQQAQLGQEFTRFTATPGQDILSRTRDAFQTQIGEGGFGISRRPLRELPRFDEGAAVGLIGEASKREESALINEALRRKSQNARQKITDFESLGGLRTDDPEAYAKLESERDNPQLSLNEERQVRELARRRLAEGMTAAGAEPTSRAGFLMKPPPPYEGLLPREETIVPTGRLRDDFGVEGGPAPLTREQEVIRDIGQGRTNFEKGFKTELEAVRQTDAATRRAAETPLEYSIRRNLELEAMGEPPAYDVNFPPTIEDAAARARQEEIDTARLARDRGFETPVQDISGFRQGVMGIPGGLADRRVVNRLLRDSETFVPPSAPPSAPRLQDELNFGGGVVPGPATPEEEAIDSVLPEFSRRRGTPKVTVGARGELPPMSEDRLPEGERIPLGGGVMYDAFDRVIYGKDGFPIFRDSQEANPNSAAPYQPEVVTPKELDKKVQEIKKAGGYEPPQAKNTLPQRRERYAMKTIKQGLELSEKPKQLARLAKTNDPAKAPEYVQLVNKVFELNSTRPDRFKLSFDEIARAYKDDPSTREKAHSYLVAIDAVQSNITKPT